jgi:hypothetical protein
MCLFLFGCRHEGDYKSRYTLIPAEESIEVQLESRSTNLSFCIQYLSSGNTDYLATMNHDYNSIELYDLAAKRLFRELVFNYEGPDALPRARGFIMKNLDTAIIVGYMPQEVCMMNADGEVFKRISYIRDSNGRSINPSFAHLGRRSLLTGDTLFLFPAYRADETKGILTETNRRNTPAYISIDLKSGEVQRSSLTLPAEITGKDITGMHTCWELGYKNCFVYYFSIIDGLFVTYDHESFVRYPIETNYRIKLKEHKYEDAPDLNKVLRYSLTHDEIIDIHYDRYRRCYYLVVFRRTDELEKNPDFRLKGLYPRGLIIIVDKDFRHMGEVFLPEDTYSIKMMYVGPKGLYISEDHVNNPGFSEDYMRFRLLTLEKIKNHNK